ncbi:hypothetical protein NAT51_14940 [Flavobacterium amniphilum]|uniref:hypothetical protein n=1 Tax=Flavobacterium amniphilum TaxID=1834035 RepID=UPI002029BFEA|nr:hypothetical protein [Flavobacterium amniphilum]MCL9806829.1 hypothetical protein [Flavobacterium amniphilum]
MAYDWALFLNDEFHPTFQKELSRQLLEKGTAGTGIKNFENYDFQLIVGLRDPEIKQIGNKVFAKIDFITPSSYHIPIEIYWASKDMDNLLEVHKNDVSEIQLEINWYEKIPMENILPYMDEIEEPE